MAAPLPRPSRPSSRDGFGVALICALTIEADAVHALFDHSWDNDGPPYDKLPNDPNAYSTGTIGRHNVVLAHMPSMGIASAAIVSISCQASFPNIKLALIVGVCGVVPFTSGGTAIHLGDVVVSDGVVQHDFGRRLPDRFERKDTLKDSLGRPNLEIRAMLAKLQTLQHKRVLVDQIAIHLKDLQRDALLEAKYPGAANDRLFEASYIHRGSFQTSCDEAQCDGRLARCLDSDIRPGIHFGTIASGNLVLRSGKDREALAVKEGVIAFEMESAGVWDAFPCLVIKGACDYADSHKNKGWQRYAAATAAACMKGILTQWVPFQSDSGVSKAPYPQNATPNLADEAIHGPRPDSTERQEGSRIMISPSSGSQNSVIDVESLEQLPCTPEDTDTSVKRLLPLTLEELYYGVTKDILIKRAVFNMPEEQLILEVPVKPGLRRGSKIKFRDFGDQKRFGHRDLHFVITELPHPTFTRDGDDLVYTVTLDHVGVNSGYERTITTLDGRSLRLRSKHYWPPHMCDTYTGLGMPVSKSPGQMGNLIIKHQRLR